MILYLAGGFHFSNTVESEKTLADHLLKQYNRYNRLATFYYEKDAKNIITVMEEVNGNTIPEEHS
jgi:outer membrane lipopolysaccharide assembly protein LptE/RlpB